MKKFNSILYETSEHIAEITLNRPDRLNALDKATLIEINEAMDLAEADSKVRVIILCGAGRAFSSGFDLKAQMEAKPAGEKVWREILDLDFNTTMRFWNSPKPTVAAIHGACMAGAFEFALSCDIAIASENAIFGEPELKFGAGIVTLLLPWVIGPKKAKDIIFTGQDRIDAPSALQLGIISRVVKDGMHLEVARQIARSIALVDPNVVMGTKKAINSAYEIQGIQKALKVALDIDHQIESVGSPDKKAFMDIARERGMREAIAWRDARFSGTTANE